MLSDMLRNKYSEVEIIKMLEFLIEYSFVVVGEQVFQQSVGIPMWTNCAPMLADFFYIHTRQNLCKTST
jgi:hypothetical protein